MSFIFALIPFLLIHSSRGLIGYDCEARSLNVSTVSLLDAGECDIPPDTVNITKQYIQLLQINEYADTQVI